MGLVMNWFNDEGWEFCTFWLVIIHVIMHDKNIDIYLQGLILIHSSYNARSHP